MYITNWIECLPMPLENVRQSQVESYQRLKKWFLISPCLTFSTIRYISRVKWSNPAKGVDASPTPWCSSYWKGSLRVTLNYGHLLYFYLYPHQVQNNKQIHSFVVIILLLLSCWQGLEYADCIPCREIWLPPSRKKRCCSWYDTELHLIGSLEIWGMWSIPSLPLLPGPLWSPVKVLSMVQIDV